MSLRSFVPYTERMIHLLALCLCCFQPPAAEPSTVVQELLRNVKEMTVSGIPGPLVVSDRAVAVVVAQQEKNQAAVVAASRMGQGRVVVFGHTGYLDQAIVQQHDTAKLLHHAIRWVGQTQANPLVGLYGAASLLPGLRQAGFNCIELKEGQLAQQLPNCGVILVASHAVNSPPTLQLLRQAVNQGKGMITAGLAWGWHQGNPGKAIDLDHPGNRLLQGSGIAFADGYLTVPGKTINTGTTVSPLVHATQAWQYLQQQAPGKPADKKSLAQASASVVLSLRYLPRDNNLLMKSAEKLMKERPGLGLVSADKPLKQEQAIERALLTARLVLDEQRPPEQCQPDPNAASFPGPVDRDAPRVTRTITIKTALPQWHTTALYAAPGDVITVKLPATAIQAKLRVRIGAHTDENWHHDKWTRSPSISRSWNLDQAEKKIASSFGGLIFIEVPENCPVPEVKVNIAQAVEAPYFKLGVTKLADWKKTIRQRPAPWAELAADQVTLIVPSRFMLQLEDPEPVLKHWNKVLRAQDELVARPLRVIRPERIAADEQISAGYMHSGYPIMTHLDAAPGMVNVEELSKGKGVSWGLYHELGHNHQHPEWTFAGTGEVTVNLFSLYTMEHVCGLKQGGHEALRYGPARQTYLQDYQTKGVSFATWQNDPFLALHMYLQLREAFGWEPFRTIFAEYRQPGVNDRPRTEEAKRDQWMIRFSTKVGKNLGPFFDAWGVPVSDTAKAAVSHLPRWMPEEWPGKR